METPERVIVKGNFYEDSKDDSLEKDSKETTPSPAMTESPVGVEASTPEQPEHDYVHVSSSKNGEVQDSDTPPSLSEFISEDKVDQTNSNSRRSSSSPNAFLAASFGPDFPDFQFPPTIPTSIPPNFGRDSEFHSDFSSIGGSSRNTGMRSRSPNTPTKQQEDSHGQGSELSQGQGTASPQGVWARCWMAMFGCCRRKKEPLHSLEHRPLSSASSGSESRPTSGQLKA